MKKIQRHNERRHPGPEPSSTGDISLHTEQDSLPTDDILDADYEILRQDGRPYFCTIPIVKPSINNQTEEKQSETDQQKELTRATDKGRELLQGMDGNQCLFYSTGWWTYSFCYKSQVRQFHALSPGAGGGRMWPPQEDPTTPSYVLGKFDQNKSKEPAADAFQGTALAELHTKSETSYLVQQLEGGTACDLTGLSRKVEVQFHCNPQLTDRIGWIKETATCSYLMVIYTPRLCNDVAFLPPKETRAHPITCQEMLTSSEVPEWEARKKYEASRKMIDQGPPQAVVIGDIEIGAMKYVGKDGKKIERGRVVLTQEEKAEIIVMQKDGQVSSMSKTDLKQLDLDPQDIDAFRKELEKLAGNKDWKIERLDDVNGQVQLRGIVSTDDDQPTEKKDEKDGPEQTGSDEEYKEEI